jgi:uncharacterized protein
MPELCLSRSPIRLSPLVNIASLGERRLRVRKTAKYQHEFRDPVHTFVTLTSDERRLIDSLPFQRLRSINQLGLSHLVYPGGTHKRFEHSLGVAELAGRIFDVITRPDKISPDIRKLLPQLDHGPVVMGRWRAALRMAALCHDLGHLPFSHVAEKELLPKGRNHETFTKEIVLDLAPLWKKLDLPLQAEEIAKLAVGPAKATDLGEFTTWEAILTEIIVGDFFGADRIDYLLRDAHHVGVTYGRFEHLRMIDSLRIVTPPVTDQDERSEAPILGVEHGGLASAESLLLSRHFMHAAVYFHPIIRIYNLHMQDFLRERFAGGGTFDMSLSDHLRFTDNEVSAALLEAALDSKEAGHDPAKRLLERGHYGLLDERRAEDEGDDLALRAIAAAASEKYGADSVRYDPCIEKALPEDFAVYTRDGNVVPAGSVSRTLAGLVERANEYVFLDRQYLTDARGWLAKERASIISKANELEEDEDATEMVEPTEDGKERDD